MNHLKAMLGFNLESLQKVRQDSGHLSEEELQVQSIGSSTPSSLEPTSRTLRSSARLQKKAKLHHEENYEYVEGVDNELAEFTSKLEQVTENVRELSRVITKLWDHSDLIQTTKTWLASKRTELSLVADDDNDKVEDMEQALKDLSQVYEELFCGVVTGLTVIKSGLDDHGSVQEYTQKIKSSLPKIEIFRDLRNAVKAANSSCKISTENRPKRKQERIDNYFTSKDQTYENKKRARQKVVSNDETFEDDDIQLVEDSKSASYNSSNLDNDFAGVRETAKFRTDSNHWAYSETDPEINNAQQHEQDMQQKRGQFFDSMGRDSAAMDWRIYKEPPPYQLVRKSTSDHSSPQNGKDEKSQNCSQQSSSSDQVLDLSHENDDNDELEYCYRDFPTIRF